MEQFDHVIYVAFGTTFMPQKRTCDILIEVMKYYHQNNEYYNRTGKEDHSKQRLAFIISIKNV